MEQNNLNVVSYLLKLPTKILQNAHQAGLQELVLKYLAEKNFFNFKKAAYLLDNPSFDCCKGVAGFDITDFSDEDEWLDLWENNDKKNRCINYAEYNKKIKTLSCNSIFLKAQNDQNIFFDFAKNSLNFNNPKMIFSENKYGNHGLFFYEERTNKQQTIEQHLFESAAAILGLTYH